MTEANETKVKKEKPLFSLDSIMGKRDLRKMVYIATFFKNWYSIPGVILGCFMINFAMGKLKHIDNWAIMMGSFFVLLIVAFLLIVLRIEMRNKNRIKYDGALIINRPLRLNFYEDRIEATTGKQDQTASLTYESFYKLMETKDYYLFFHNESQISLLRKSEIDDEDSFKSFILKKFPSKFKQLKFM